MGRSEPEAHQLEGARCCSVDVCEIAASPTGRLRHTEHVGGRVLAWLPFEAEWRAFYDACVNGTQVLTPLADSRADLELIAKIVRVAGAL